MSKKIKAIGARDATGAHVWADDKGRIPIKNPPRMWLFGEPIYDAHRPSMSRDYGRITYLFTADVDSLLNVYKTWGICIQVDETRNFGTDTWYAEVYATCEPRSNAEVYATCEPRSNAEVYAEVYATCEPRSNGEERDLKSTLSPTQRFKVDKDYVAAYKAIRAANVTHNKRLRDSISMNESVIAVTDQGIGQS